MKPLGPFMRAALAVAVLLGALALVPWRQSRALEALAKLDQVRRQTSVATAERVDLERNIQVLESRGRVVPLARERLGMHTPSATELVILPGDPNS
jgi:cell division protein FtsL